MSSSSLQLSSHQALLVSAPSDITYLTGFEFLVPEEREAFIVLTHAKKYLIKASFSPVPANIEYEILQNCQPGILAQHLSRIVGHAQISELLIDPTTLFLQENRAIESLVHIPINTFDRSLFWQQRMVKKPVEIAALRRAATIAEHALHAVKLTIGMTEKHVCALLEDELRKLGSQRPAFPTIVAFGAHTAAPHHQPSDFALRENMPVLIDMGATIDGYRSDMTRSWWFGEKKDPQFQIIEETVQRAYDAALQRLSSQPLARELDAAARDIIAAAGFASTFIHTTGHGVGLDIHEPPSLNARNDQAIQPNMVITIEPGIYLDGKFGYRHENTVLVTKDGGEELTQDG